MDQCDQIWRNLATLAKYYRYLAIFEGLFSNCVKSSTYFGTFCMPLSACSSLYKDKFQKLTQPSGRTVWECNWHRTIPIQNTATKEKASRTCLSWMRPQSHGFPDAGCVPRLGSSRLVLHHDGSQLEPIRVFMWSAILRPKLKTLKKILARSQ